MNNLKETHSNLLHMAQKINSEILSMKHWFDEIPQLVAIGDGVRFVRVNKMFEQVLGWTPDEIVKMQWISLAHPDDIEPTLEAFTRKGNAILSFFNRYRTKEGDYIWLQWTISPLRHGETYISAIPHYESSAFKDFLSKLSNERNSIKSLDFDDLIEVK